MHHRQQKEHLTKKWLQKIDKVHETFANANESLDVTFKKANDLYNKEDYQNALQTFESIEKQGNISADLYFNIGNCYYKLWKVAPSIYNY